jgi:hypothetical protein
VISATSLICVKAKEDLNRNRGIILLCILLVQELLVFTNRYLRIIMSLEQQQQMYQSLIAQNKKRLQLEKNKDTIQRLNDQIDNAQKAIYYITIKSSN